MVPNVLLESQINIMIFNLNYYYFLPLDVILCRDWTTWSPLSSKNPTYRFPENLQNHRMSWAIPVLFYRGGI